MKSSEQHLGVTAQFVATLARAWSSWPGRSAVWRRQLQTLIAVLLIASSVYADIGWKTQRIHDEFLTEGAAAGDINRDGHADLVAGPVWYAGPGFTDRFLIDEAKVVSTKSYSKFFFTHVHDFNGDGLLDVLSIGFPGRAADLYLNPGPDKLDSLSGWTHHRIADKVSNESPWLIDLIPGGQPEIACARNRQYGFYTAGDDATEPWRWQPISAVGTAAEPFGHGLGVGDVDGDGRLDIVDKDHWWRQPDAEAAQQWEAKQWAAQPYGRGGAQIFVDDVDGDGDQDIVTSLNAHGYGLAWFERVSADRFVRSDICGATSIDNPFGFTASQLHAVELADIDGDGRKDIVTGKRFFAHGGKDPGGLQPPVLTWFRNTATDDGIEFVPHVIDDNSGAGVEVLVADLNGDDRLDVVSSNKKGLAIHFQTESADGARTPQRWRTPKKPLDEYADGWSPEEAARSMAVPDRFSVDLIAAEPDLVQPIATCFDDRGRIWVVEGMSYPRKAPDGEGKDRILILSDNDGDGTFESRKVFADGLNLVSGIEVGFGGVWVGAAPELLFFPDADRDDVPDSEPQVLLDGWGYQDTHETLNSFTWGPDGWLYGCHGVFTHSRVGKPGTPKSRRTRINAGVWRYHPTDHRFEVFAEGTSNPWGVDFNAQGECFVTACVIPHLFHLSQGGRYFRQAGNHFNPYIYEDIATITDHLHYGDGTFASGRGGFVNRDLVKRTAASTSEVGGGHAHCGLVIYQAGEFPAHFRGDFLFHNLHGHRIVRDAVEPAGSGFVGRQRPDFALSHDHRQIGVAIMQGPDGAIYTTDWHDPQTCHNRDPEVWDRSDGRLFRIRYRGLRPYKFDLQQRSDAELVELLDHSNIYFVRRAQRILQQRAGQRSIDPDALAALETMRGRDQNQSARLHALWTSWVVGQLPEEQLASLLDDPDPYVRGWSLRFVGESSDPVSVPMLSRLESMAKSEQSLVTRRFLASLLQRLPLEQRWNVLAGLAGQSLDNQDPNLPLLVWYAAEPLAEVDPERLLALSRRGEHQALKRLVARRLAASADGRESLVHSLKPGAGQAHTTLVLKELLTAARNRGGVAMPPSWPEHSQRLRDTNQQKTAELAAAVAIQFGDHSVYPHFRRMLRDRSKPRQHRRESLNLLSQAKDPQLPELLLELIDDREIAADAIRALAAYDRPEIPAELLSGYQSLDPQTRAAALTTLSSRPHYARKLVSAMEADTVPAKSVPAYVVRQIRSLGDEELLDRLEQVWGTIASESKVTPAVYQRYRKMLPKNLISRADVREGKKLYDANCGKCHRLFGEGGDIGPDLTGANRTDLTYWLENILDPNAVLGRAYQMTTFLLVDGRVINGLVRSENEDAVTVQTATDELVLVKANIEQRKQSNVSLMPEGQLEPLSDQQVRQLFRYLMGPDPHSSLDTLKVTVHVIPGAIEAESQLAVTKLTGGKAQVQSMGSFGNLWSAGKQLWWTGGKPGDELKMSIQNFQQRLPAQTAEANIGIQLTTAVDYAEIQLRVGDQPYRAIDLYSPDVAIAELVVFRGIKIDPRKPLKLEIRITGANAKAQKRYMVGIDAITVTPNSNVFAK